MIEQTNDELLPSRASSFDARRSKSAGVELFQRVMELRAFSAA
jgi:hypothetical protein